ncbi:MAG: hypothetical protein FJW39_24650 [Acidobacteria bacterium]|nr:hypothetical protein [Acidobacteriota bacterium]
MSEGAARMLWPGKDPLGKTVRIDRRWYPGILPKHSDFLVAGVIRERVERDGVDFGTDRAAARVDQDGDGS